MYFQVEQDSCSFAKGKSIGCSCVRAFTKIQKRIDMSKFNLTWQASDAQLLDALLLATGGEGAVSLQDVLLMTDALNGDVPSLKELEQGLEKLVSVGFVVVQKNRLALSEEFLTRYEATTLNSAAAGEANPLQKLLEQIPLTEAGIAQAKADTLKTFKIRNQYQAYLEQYG